MFNPFSDDKWKQWPLPVVQFTVQQADNKLKFYVELSRKITDRAFSLLTPCLTIFILISGWLINSLIRFTEFNVLIAISLEIMIILFAVMCILMWLLYPHQAFAPGTEPEEILRPELLTHPFTDKSEMELAILIQEAVDLQVRIKHNKLSNEKRQSGIEWVIRLIISILPLTVITFFIFS